MAVNTFGTTTAIGNREDLIDLIYNTAPTDTPLISAVEKIKATGVTHEWQRDVIATPATNAVAEGADAANAVVPPTQRLSNQTQISRKAFSISDTQEAVSKAGRKSEIRYQTILQGKALRKDMELACIENPTYTTGATRQTKGLRGFCVTNNSLGATGVAPAFPNTAPTDGTLRNLTEAFARAVVLGCYQNGGNISMMMVAPGTKQTISNTFTGNGTKFIKGETNKVEGAWDMWGTDFGDLKIVPNRVMQRTREIYFVDADLIALAVLRDMQDGELARTGSARNFMLETEYALQVGEERGIGCGRDFQ